jgi:hypothetical protein
MRIDYENPEVVARQNIAPNAGCDIDGVFYDMRNCVYLLNEQADRIEELDGIIRQGRERIEELVSMVNSKDARIEELEDKLTNIAHAVWTEHKDWEGERKYALRQIVKWLVRAGQD